METQEQRVEKLHRELSDVGSGPSMAAMAAPLLAHQGHTHQHAMHA